MGLELEITEEQLVEAFRRLPIQQRGNLLEKLQEVCKPQVHSVPASRLHALTGLVSLGGDALADAEAIYDDRD